MRAFETAFPSKFLVAYQAGCLRYTYRGVRCLKSPIDMAIYLKATWDMRPGTVFEVGSHSGGSALFLADMLTAFGIDAHVYSIDLKPPTNVRDHRISFLEGDVRDLRLVFEAHKLSDAPRPWFVIEDSAHTFEGCMAALQFFSRTMASGDLLVIEDGVLDELGLSERYHGGPNRAIRTFQMERPGTFEIVTAFCDMFGTNATYSPNGFLKKL